MKKFLMPLLFIFLIVICGNTVVLSQEQGLYGTRELSRDENYKLIEMYVYDNDDKISRVINFELPVEWKIDDSSVVGLVNEANIDSYGYERPYYKLKVDMWNIIESTREELLDEIIESKFISGEYMGDAFEIIDENIYSTDSHEIFYYKYYGVEAVSISAYYIYKNGERFAMTGYLYDTDIPEYDDIFNRIAESVRFQFDINEISSPETGNNILIYVILLPISLVLISKKYYLSKIKY